MLRFVIAFVVGIGLVGALAAGPTVFAPRRLSSVQPTSVRVQSVPKPRPSVYIGGSSYRGSSRSSSSGRYSSGGGFSSGK